MGVYFANQFHLLVSLRFTPQAGELEFLAELFEQVSRILHDATDGAHSIGHVFVAIDSWGTKSADVFVHKLLPGHEDEEYLPNATDARLWFPQESIDIWQNSLPDATVVAHELAHYLYDVRDEYIGLEPWCVKVITDEACLMEGYYQVDHTRWVRTTNLQSISSWALFLPEYNAHKTLLQPGQPSDFCHPGNHDPVPLTDQNTINGLESCWSWMVGDHHGKLPYGLVLPPTAGPALPAPAAPLAVVLVQLIPVQRFALVLDRSASMGGTKLEHLKVGANFWIDYVNTGEELAIIGYASTPAVAFARSEVPLGIAVDAWRTDRHAIVDTLVASGSTAIGDALRSGLQELITGGLAADQVLLLFSDGMQNFGTVSPEAVLPELIAANVRVYAIGLGADQNATLLELIATATGGKYYPIGAGLTAEEAEDAITETLIYIAGESRNASSVSGFSGGLGGPAPPGVPEPPFPWMAEHPRALRPRMPEHAAPDSLEFPVVIAAGSIQCTLGVYWKAAKADYEVTIVDPNGTTIAPGAGVRHVRGIYPYVFYVVERPAGGTWTVRVSAPKISGARLCAFGFQVHTGFRLESGARRTIVRPGSEVRIPIRLLVPQPVPGARITAWVRPPGKGTSRMVSIGDGAQEHGRAAPSALTLTFKTDPEIVGPYLVAVHVSRPAGSFEYVPDGLHWIGSKRPKNAERVKVDVPAIEQRLLLSFVTDASGRYDEAPLHGWNDRVPFVPKDQARQVERRKRSRRR